MKKTTILVIAAIMTIAGGALIAQTNVTVPNTFSASTTAKAADVNANFSALVQAMPGVKGATLATASVTLTTGGAADARSLGSITITAPRAGYAIVRAHGMVNVTGTNVAFLAVSNSATAMNTNPTSDGALEVGGNSGAGGSFIPFYSEGVFPVTSGAATFYLVASGNGAFSYTVWPCIVVEFVPNSY